MTELWTNFVSTIKSTTAPVLALGIILFLIVYFIPGWIAIIRRTKNRAQVRVINIFLGLSFVGRVIALAMAYSPDVEERPTEETPID